ncbi:MAG TPA: hypothetical protein VGM50_09950 [Gemmatimonadaceae bacterium]|jgi:hypothetical protein
MRYQQNAVLGALRHAQTFFDENPTAVAGLSATARNELDRVTDAFSKEAVNQDAGLRGTEGEVSRGRSLRTALRAKHMAPIAEVAKYKLQSMPEFSSLTLPSVNISEESLVASATSMADAAAVHAQTFIDSGLLPSFVDDLRTATKAVSISSADRATLKGVRNGGTAGLDAWEKQGRAMLRVLDRLVLAQIGDDAALRRRWETAKAVQRKPGPSAKAGPVVSAGGQPTTTPVVAPKPVTTSTPVVTSVVVPTLVPTLAPTSTAAVTPPASVPVAA